MSKVKVLATVLAVIVLLPLPTAAFAQSIPPAVFYGTAYVDNVPVAGATVSGWIDGVNVAETTTAGDGSYYLKVEGNFHGKTVFFKVAGYDALWPAIWEIGRIVLLDLHATTGPTPPDTDGDNVPDSKDLFPNYDAYLLVAIKYFKETKAADLIGYGDPYFIIDVDGDRWMSSKPAFGDVASATDPYSVTVNIADDQRWLDIHIEAWDYDGGWTADEQYDISEDPDSIVLSAKLDVLELMGEGLSITSDGAKDGGLRGPQAKIIILLQVHPIDTWIPYTPSPDALQIEIIPAEVLPGPRQAKVTFSPGLGVEVKDWGSIKREGNVFSVDAVIEEWTGAVILPVVEPETNIYELGIIQPGDYKFRFYANGNFVKEEPFVVDPGTGSLLITSEPPGAEVYLDDDFRGRAPLIIEELEPGSYELEVTLEGYEDWEKRVVVKAGKITSVLAELTALPPPHPAEFTTTDLTITPEEVFTGEEVIISAMVANIGELAGTHQVILKIDDVVEATQEITLDGGARQEV
ncbi:PEGA domain-containing protein, partial [Dehalococcoidia bacterium]|nr:PEGA domain-containing protein [Dehalococcoidia bacterium]